MRVQSGAGTGSPHGDATGRHGRTWGSRTGTPFRCERMWTVRTSSFVQGCSKKFSRPTASFARLQSPHGDAALGGHTKSFCAQGRERRGPRHVGLREPLCLQLPCMLNATTGALEIGTGRHTATPAPRAAALQIGGGRHMP